MKRFMLFGFFLPLAAVSCGPLSYTMSVEMRNPSKSGLDLGRKTFSIVYVDNGNRTDSVFAASVSEGLAGILENDYFSGERTIGIYRADGNARTDYWSKDSMLDLLMDTESDVVFLLDAPKLGTAVAAAPEKVTGKPLPADSLYVSEISVPFSIKLYVYDSMNPSDSVFSFHGDGTVAPAAYTDGKETADALIAKGLSAIGPEAAGIGRKCADTFVSTWTGEHFDVVYYDNTEWLDAAFAASDYRWDEALDIWLKLADTGNVQKRSCAGYNIALACYMMGRYSLAKEWLDRSDKDYPLHVSKNLRQRINERSSGK